MVRRDVRLADVQVAVVRSRVVEVRRGVSVANVRRRVSVANVRRAVARHTQDD